VVEKYYRPTLLLCAAESSGLLKGSGRSIPEFNLHEGLVSLGELFEGFGGHAQAAGVSLKPGNLGEFRERFNAKVIEALGPKPLTPTLKLDHELPFSSIDNTLLKELELLQPYGMGNPEPVFATRPVRVAEHALFGREREHVKLVLEDQETGTKLPGKAWRMADTLTSVVRGRTMRFAFTPKIDRYMGIPKIDLRIKDWIF
jgi:single-stranded-DNA-specific exonuclease